MKGDWIDFKTLCERVPSRSATTLRRMVKDRQISSRQRVQGGKREFNWHTVERELAALESRSTARVEVMPIAQPPAEFVSFIEQLRADIFREFGILRGEIRAAKAGGDR